MRWFFLLFSLYSAAGLSAATMGIRLLADYQVSSVIIAPTTGQYRMVVDGREIPNTDIFQLLLDRDSIKIKTFESQVGKCAMIRFIPINEKGSFKMKPLIPSARFRSYDDELEVTVLNGSLRMINYINIENYTAGVVETESGRGNFPEFYKIQAILCRTYALSHLRRHEAENYHLCDKVHCQAYKGRSTDARILEAVYATQGMVAVDTSMNLVTAAFHSNCGGETVNSEDAWSMPLPYLRSRKDTFCLRMPNANWIRKINKSDWDDYIRAKQRQLSGDTGQPAVRISYSPARQLYCSYQDQKIPLKIVRDDWKLRSTYFYIEEKQDSLLFRGKGYGHGVGLCQEGAMRMAQYGYSYTNILNFYFSGIKIIDLNVLDFFREDE